MGKPPVDAENLRAVLFWNASTWKVSLGMCCSFGPVNYPFQLVTVFLNYSSDAEKAGAVAT